MSIARGAISLPQKLLWQSQNVLAASITYKSDAGICADYIGGDRPAEIPMSFFREHLGELPAPYRAGKAASQALSAAASIEDAQQQQIRIAATYTAVPSRRGSI